MSTMSSALQASPGSSSPNFQPILDKALKEYKKKTGKDLTTHPLAAEINGCNSPEAILTVLQGKTNELNDSRRSNERLTKWLAPTVNVLNALSATLGQGVGSVFPASNIIFSGISVLLVAAKDAAASHEALVELFDRIEGFFSRLKTHTEVPPTVAITDVLAKIMAEVLSMLAIATKQMKRGRIRTFLTKVAGINNIEDALVRLDKLEQCELRTVIAQVARDTSGLKDGIEAIAQQMVARDWGKLLRDLRGWISPPDPSTNHNIACGAQHERTSEWLFKEIIFKEWESKGSLLWIHGKPGSGKSVLCSAIIQHLETQHDAGSASLAYFYFDFRDTKKQHLRDLLCSLLIQLSANSNSCCDIMYHLYSRHGEGTRQPSDETLRKCLKEVLSATSHHPNYIIMDALDECPNTTGVPSARDEVLGLLNDLVDLRLPNLHICVTSRPETDIRTFLEPSTSRRISLHDQPGQKEDIAEYIKSVVHSDNNMKRWREDDRTLVIDALSEKADGMFRWVFCQLEVLRHCLSASLRRHLHELPQSLDETYERILREIHLTNQDNARRLLHCIAVAQRPLLVEELAEVLAFDLDAAEGEIPTFHAEWRWEDQEQAVLSACSGLISIVRDAYGSRVVQFSHFSVKEFLTSKRLAAAGGDVSQFHILPGPAHTILTQACLGVLLRLDDHVNERNAKNIPLATYAAKHWVSHAQVENATSRVGEAMGTLFDSEKPHFSAWLRIYCEDPQPRSWWDQMLTPPEPGLKTKNSPEPPKKRKPTMHDNKVSRRNRNHYIPRRAGIPSEYAKPLYYSALYGFYNLVEQLAIKYPQHINAIGGDHRCPLLAALRGKHVRVAEFLLERGANIDVRGSKNQTPLHYASQWSDDVVFDAMQFLLKHGADVNARRDDLSTPLHLAAYMERFKSTQMLLAYKADVDSRDQTGKTPLHMVSYMASVKTFYVANENPLRIAQLLTENGAEANVQDRNYETPLHLASQAGIRDVVRILLDRGAEVNAANKWGETPLYQLSQSSSGDQLGVAQLLLERGADANRQDDDHITPLHFASEHGSLEFTRLLLNHGAKVNAANKRGKTPLHQLSQRSKSGKSYLENQLGITQLLLERGANVNTQDNDHTTPLHLASDYGGLDIARALLDHGAKVNAQNNRGETPLHQLSKGFKSLTLECLDVARLLLERGADVNARDEDHVTPLHLACYDGTSHLARVLLDYGANVNAKDDHGQSPLFQLIERERSTTDAYQYLNIAGLLVKRGADANTRGKDNTTALHLVSKHGKPGLVQVLMDHGANVNSENNWGQTPLHLSSKRNLDADQRYLDVVKSLIERGADVNARDKDNTTPLHLAASSDWSVIAPVLLNGGAYANARNNCGQTPLHLLLANYSHYGANFLGFVHLLLKHGVDVNAEDEDHTTALHLTLDREILGVTPVLLDHGASPNAKNNLGETPLHRLLTIKQFSEDRYRNLDSVRLLLEHGADPNVEDKDGVTPLQLASRKAWLKVARLLRDHGAKDATENDQGRTLLHTAHDPM